MADKKKANLDSIVGYNVPNHENIKKKLIEYSTWELNNEESLLADSRRSINKIYQTLDDKKEGLHRHGDINKTKLEEKIDDVYSDLGKALEAFLEDKHKASGAEKAYGVFKEHFETEKKKGNEDYFNAVLKEFETMHGGTNDLSRSQLKQVVDQIRSKGGSVGELLNNIPKLMENVYTQRGVQVTKQRKKSALFQNEHYLHVQDVAKKEFIDKYDAKVDMKPWKESELEGAIEVAKYVSAPNDKKHLATPHEFGVTYQTPLYEKEKK